MSAIKLSHVYKTYLNDRHALRDITLDIESNEFVFLTGHSGAGKSTLFKILSAQESVSSGSVFVLEKNLNDYTYKNIHSYRRQIGIIFQDYKLIPHLTNYENLVLPLQVLKKTNAETESEVKHVSELVGINLNCLSEYPEMLSGGEQQKIAIARAIIHRPKIIFADEPTGNLDKASSVNILAILKELTKWNTTVFFATHDESLLSQTSARIVNLKHGEIESSNYE